MSNAWKATDQTGLFLKWVHCTGDPRREPDLGLLEGVEGGDEVRRRWEGLVQTAQEWERNDDAARAKPRAVNPILLYLANRPVPRRPREGGGRTQAARQQQVLLSCVRGFVGQEAGDLQLILDTLPPA